MPKETEIEVIYGEIKQRIAELYENNKGFKIAPMKEIDIVDYLEQYFFHNIDNFFLINSIITESELVPFKNDTQINLMFRRIRNLRK